MVMTKRLSFQTPSTPHLLLTTQQGCDDVVVTLVGELDIAGEVDPAATVDAIVANRAMSAMDFDATGVSFVDSSGLRSLGRARQAAVANRLALSLRIAQGGQVDGVIEMSGLHDRLVDYIPETAVSPVNRAQ